MTKTVYTIPPQDAFIDRLAEGLWAQAGNDPIKLADMLILLPTRRACRALREAFPRVTGIRAALLPRMTPLGDLDEDEFYFADADILNADIPPAISPLRRQLLLARLIRRKDKDMSFDQAAQLAEALGRWLDEVQFERLDFSGLEKLVEGDLAEHWRQTLTFLDIVTAAWPEMLAAEGCIDPATRRNRVIEAQAALWRAKPPAYPVIAAGSTGSLPATGDLLEVIASLPQGAVILPGLDKDLDEEAWQAVDETHPQAGMKELLKKIGLTRDKVKLWPACKTETSPRVRLLQEAMRPAEATDAWRHLKPKDIPREALKGFSRLTLDNAQEEAQVIALLMRAALEQPQKTAALVTADRMLAERVAALLGRWRIEVNDSAGAALAAQPAGSFLLDVLAATAPNATPIDYLALLKHPLAAIGLDPAVCRAQARQIEVAVWRGAGPQDRAGEAQIWLDEFKRKLFPFAQNARKALPLAERLKAHIALAEQLAASDREKGADRLWGGESGEAVATWLEEWQNAAAGFPALQGDEYANLFTALLRAATMRPLHGQHPRLSILGPLEARLAQTDLVVLGGLNEGSWPPETAIDPWMSRPMKKTFGLPLPEKRIGLSAHDFVQIASAPNVVLTRAQRAGNAPTVPSRFLLQLETVLSALGYHGKDKDALAPQEPWAAWARELDRPAAITPCAAPEPRPPAAARPRKLGVTDIGIWRRNPYAIYAKYILQLRKLEPLEIDATAADKGTIIHKALEVFLSRNRDRLPPEALDALLEAGRAAFAPYKDQPYVTAFWWPRFERIAGWFIEQERARRAAGIENLKAEAKGTMTFGKTFTLTGRADRIDRLPDGTLEIVDYKTGGLPKQADIKAGYEPQLPLLALIAAWGGFEGIPAAQAEVLAYWKLSGGAEPAKEQAVNESAAALTKTARAGLEQLIAQFADPQTPYQAVPKPGRQPRHDDYAHLARLAEWGRTAEDT